MYHDSTVLLSSIAVRLLSLRQRIEEDGPHGSTGHSERETVRVPHPADEGITSEQREESLLLGM